MKINQIEPWYGEEERKAVIDYLNSNGWLMEYKKTEELERMIADYTGSRFCSILCNGTMTLFTALKAYNIGHGDEVLCPAYSMIASATSISLTGAKPVFCDVERNTFCIDFEDIKKKITDKTKALMLVSINGRYPNGIHQIIELCNENDIVIIEDAAQSLGSFYDGEHVGTYGVIGSFSFSYPKITSAGQGGALVTDSEYLYKQIEMIKDFGRPQSGVDQHEIIGWNFKYTDLQSVFLIEQMKKLPERVKLKKQLYQWYKEELEEVKDIEFIETDPEACPMFVDILSKGRETIIDGLQRNDIGVRRFYPTITSQKPYLGFSGEFPNADYIARYGLWLPSSLNLHVENVIFICDTIKRSLI